MEVAELLCPLCYTKNTFINMIWQSLSRSGFSDVVNHTTSFFILFMYVTKLSIMY